MADVAIKPIQRLLVANRGEIARRIFRTAHAMGISSAAVYADGDANAPFAKEADLAVALDGATSTETYLDIDKILGAAARVGADAIHPGYGFLSENAEFARRVVASGLIWVGPPPEAIDQMGDKLAAKQAMAQAGVPTLDAFELGPGADAPEAAERIGYPILIKASAGGGGRGMRVVESADELANAIASAQREAGAAFGNDTVFLERWLTASRHVEIQIMGDQHGNLAHLFERECSIQRRHQKIIEEAPSPAVTSAIRTRMGEAAVNAAQAIGYCSAGTVEFLLAGDDFWFLEVNTRLQVEHPVTEAITGIDLVREQLRIAEGEAMSFSQSDLKIDGHAIEARLYAEDPAKNFLPSPGTISVWTPSSLARFDSGVEAGSDVSMNFDPMIAKVISHAPTRREAAAQLARALDETRIQGIANNRDFLVATLRTPAFIAGDTTTDFIERINPPRTRTADGSAIKNAAVAAALFSQSVRRDNAKVLRSLRSGWRNSLMPPETVTFDVAGENVSLEYRSARDGAFACAIEGDAFKAYLHGVDGAHVDLTVDAERGQYAVACIDDHYHVDGPHGSITLTERPRFPLPGEAEFKGGLFAPMPGKVLSTSVSVGDQVKAGALLVILEAMKMEHRITAPVDGTVRELTVQAGDQVQNGQRLVMLEEG